MMHICKKKNFRCIITNVSLNFEHTCHIRIPQYGGSDFRPMGSDFSLRGSGIRPQGSETRPNGPEIRPRGSEIRKDRNPHTVCRSFLKASLIGWDLAERHDSERLTGFDFRTPTNPFSVLSLLLRNAPICFVQSPNISKILIKWTLFYNNLPKFLNFYYDAKKSIPKW